MNWWDVGGAALVGGLIGFGLGSLIPAVGAMIGGAASTGSIGAGLAAGGGAFAAASGWLDGGGSPPEATQPEATQPEATQPEATQPEATQPEATQPEAAPETSSMKVNINPNKFKYLFGEVTSGDQHNIDRSRQLAWYMKSLGINNDEEGRALLTEHLESVAQDAANTVETFANQWGLNMRKDSLLFGPSGNAYMFRSSWILRDSGVLDFTTLIPSGRNPGGK